MKTIVVLITLMIGSYYGIDHLLGKYFQTQSPTKNHEQQELVQKMAQFLDSSDQIQHELTKQHPSSDSKTSTQKENSHSSQASSYLGSSPTEQFFKTILDKRAANQSDQSDNDEASLNNTIEMLEYVKNNPKDTIEALENALNRIPMELTEDRELLKSAYIHASINFIEELPEDRNLKITYLKRLSDSVNDPEVKTALKSHFSTLISDEKNSGLKNQRIED